MGYVTTATVQSV